ncbi:carbonic anhydrase 2-like [Bradysia coprophila]|uniref:carbonic anhydrase 2-like n=1 Tax=Bradysia coprophila TaxID=38358 RepID=UPI00187D7977|nr:carbonic anhydrase 2-like [Bradysia coprophila]
MIQTLFCVILAYGCVSAGTGDWENTYYETDAWKFSPFFTNAFPVCQRKRQSPIDINSCDVIDANLPPLQWNGFNRKLTGTLTNNGHTAKLTTDPKSKPIILSGGPLYSAYQFSELHFHWGDTDKIGSERAMKGKKYPIELHVVTFNTDYGNIKSAMNYPDGICALSCLFELQDKDNENYSALVAALSKVVKPHTSATIIDHPTLFQLLPSILSRYYTYGGSLTTPPYPEVVTWIDFVQTVKISRKQLQSFRHLIDDHGQPMVNNFREIQPLNDREVIRNDDNYC